METSGGCLEFGRSAGPGHLPGSPHTCGESPCRVLAWTPSPVSRDNMSFRMLLGHAERPRNSACWNVSPGTLTFAGGWDPCVEWWWGCALHRHVITEPLILEFHIGKNGVGHPELKAICAGSELPALCSRLGASGRPVWLGLLHASWLNCMFDVRALSMAAEASRDVHGKVMLSIGFTPRWSRVSLGQGAGSGRPNGGPHGCGPSVVSGSPQNVAMGAPACHAHVSWAVTGFDGGPASTGGFGAWGVPWEEVREWCTQGPWVLRQGQAEWSGSPGTHTQAEHSLCTGHFGYPCCAGPCSRQHTCGSLVP